MKRGRSIKKFNRLRGKSRRGRRGRRKVRSNFQLVSRGGIRL